MEDFERDEQRLSNKEVFDALVGFTSLKMDVLLDYWSSTTDHLHSCTFQVTYSGTYSNRCSGLPELGGRTPKTVCTKSLTGMFVGMCDGVHCFGC